MEEAAQQKRTYKNTEKERHKMKKFYAVLFYRE